MSSMFNNASVKMKLFVMALIALFGLMSILIGSYSFFKTASKELNEIQYVDLKHVQLTNDLQVGLVDVNRLFEATVVEEDLETLNEALRLSTDLRMKIAEMAQAQPLVEYEVNELGKKFDEYIEETERYTRDVIAGRYRGDEMYSAFSSALSKREGYERYLRSFSKNINSRFEMTMEKLRKRSENTTTEQFVFGIFLIVLVMFSFMWLIKVVNNAIENVIYVAGEIANGNLDVEVTKTGSGEFQSLFHALSLMRDRLKEQYAESESRTSRQLQLTKLNEALRGELTVEELGDNLLRYFCEELDVLMGALFLHNDEYLELVSSFACGYKNGFSIPVGKTLVGVVAQNKKVMRVKNVPDEYPDICSGIGEAKPNELMIVPLCLNDHILGVLELASFNSFHQIDMDLLDKVSESMAIALNSTISRIRLGDALKQTRQQADVLEEQQEQLRKTNQELEDQAATLRLSELNLQHQQEELKFVNGELEERNQLLDSQKDEIERKNRALERSGEELQAKARQLELSGQYKSEFLSTMSHELRTPLNSILILSQALADNKSKNMTERQIEHANVIHSSGNDLLMLINDILDLSKVEEGKLDLLSENIAISDFLEKLRWQFKAQAEDKNIKFHFIVDDKAPVSILNDEHRLGQILRNFISNAFKFTENGTVSIRVAEFTNRSSLRFDKPMVVFDVIDTGIGIPKDKLNLIFEAFQQVDGTISRKFGGTGLGLTISKKLALLMGGDISVHSEGKDKGAVFSLVIPQDVVIGENIRNHSFSHYGNRASDKMVGQSVHLVAGTPLAEASLRDNVILIIEDDPGFSRVLKNLAEEYGFKAICVHSAGDAQKYLNKSLPGSIILDLGLPDAPGEHFLNHLISVEKTKDIPVHVISGKANVKLEELQGAKEFIQKPFGRARLDQLFLNIKNEMSHLNDRRVLVINDDELDNMHFSEGLNDHDIQFDMISSRKEHIQQLADDVYKAIIVNVSGLYESDVNSIQSLFEGFKGGSLIILCIDTSVNDEVEWNHGVDLIFDKSNVEMKLIINEMVKYCIEPQPDNVRQKSVHVNVNREYRSKTVIDMKRYKERKILLVDDDIRNLYSLSAILEDAGFFVESATTGLEAMNLINGKKDYDLILMDIMMPEMDGLEAIRQIRLHSEYKDTPIIALTAKAMQNDRRICIEAGANDYMPKPINSGKLKENVDLWINRIG